VRTSDPFLVDDLIDDRALESAELDSFRHAELASVVAALVSEAPTPMNVALYGPWGSGKTSFFALLREKIRERVGESVAVVRYDAWKYEGEALQRHFIGEAAVELGVDPPDVYERQETTKVDTSSLTPRRLRELAGWLVKWVGPVLLVGLGVYVAWSAVVAAATSVGFVDEIARVPAVVLAPSIIVGMLLAGGRLIVGESFVTATRERPEDEELEAAFDALLEKARAKRERLLKKRYERFVFFIDELDRCTREEVVATLSAVKNFLNKKDTVFVVAADRDVLEQALRELPQSNPANEEAPYYSSASEFLDKVFQTQLSLPPLREQRRTRFARDLVLAKEGGLWRELRQVDDGRLLDDVIFLLIPPHAQSPRRIKILLNNFALNARTVGARGLQWLERATEIAKLTVFQTEFPLFADDLHLEPRLPRLLLEPSGEGLSSRTARLLERHRLPHAEHREMPATPDETEAATGASETDRLLTEDEEQKAQLVSAQREQLRRYLETREAFPDPAPDLLYLEGIGAAVDLPDTELGILLEVDAPERPSVVTRQLDKYDSEERRKAALVLASLVEQNFGREQQNLMHVLMHVVRALGDELEDAADPVVAAIRRYQADGQTLDEDWLTDALGAAVSSEQTQERPLTEALFADERLLADSARVTRISLRLDQLRPAERTRIYDRIGELYEEDEDVLLAPLHELPTETVSDLLEATFSSTVGEAFTTERGENLFAAVVEREDGAHELGFEIETRLLALEDDEAYAVAKEHAASLISGEASKTRAAELGLAGLAQAPAEDWPFWNDTYRDAAKGGLSAAEATTTSALRALMHILNALPTAAPTAQDQAVEVICSVVETVGTRSTEEAPLSELVEAASATVGSRPWWEASEAREQQERLYRAVGALRLLGGPVQGEVEQLIVADLERAFAAAPESAEAAVAAASMAPELTLESLRRLAAQLEAAATNAAVTRARLAMAGAAKQQGADPIAEAVFRVDGEAVLALPGDDVSVQVSAWLALGQPVEQALFVVKQLETNAKTISAFERWALELSASERTTFLLGVADDPEDQARWVEVLAREPIEELPLVSAVADRLETAGRAPDRALLASILAPLRLSEQPAQRRAVELISFLVGKRTEKDVSAAVTLLPILGNKHGGKSRLEREFRQVLDDEKRKLPRRALDDFAAAGVSLPQKYFRSKKKGKKGLLGRLGL
jgi:KAP family P-loop domain